MLRLKKHGVGQKYTHSKYMCQILSEEEFKKVRQKI